MGGEEFLPAEGTLVVSFEGKAVVLVNDHERGHTNEPIELQVGDHQIRLKDVVTKPLVREVKIRRDTRCKVSFEPSS